MPKGIRCTSDEERQRLKQMARVKYRTVSRAKRRLTHQCRDCWRPTFKGRARCEVCAARLPEDRFVQFDMRFRADRRHDGKSSRALNWALAMHRLRWTA